MLAGLVRAVSLIFLSLMLGGCQDVVQSMLPEKTRGEPVQTGLPDARWQEPASLVLRLESDRKQLVRAWRYQFAAGGELLITPERQTVHGRLLLLDDRTLLVEGDVVEANNPVGTIDRPALDKELLLRLLATAWPYNPLAVHRLERVSLPGIDQAMMISAGSDEESYIGPWDLKGSLRRRGDWSVLFELSFRYPELSNRGRSETRYLRGEWQGGPRRALDPNMSLQGWRVYEFVPSTRISAGISIASFQAQLESVRFATLAEARDYARYRR